MFDLRAYNDVVFRVDEVLGEKYRKWLNFDKRFFYDQDDFNRAFLAYMFDIEPKSRDLEETKTLLVEPLKTYFDEGTSAAVRKAVKAIDGDALVVEGNLSQRYDGAIKYDKSRFYGSNSHWAEYSIITSKQTDTVTAQKIREAAQNAAPVRCVLVAIESRAAPPLYDDKIKYDGKFNYGVY